jgi:hypothetical protein
MSVKKKPILVVASHFVKPVETRINNEFEVQRKPDGTPFQHGELLAFAEGADALFITPFDRLDADFFERVSRHRRGAHREASSLAGGSSERVTRFTLETTTAGDAEILKEYLISTEIYERKPPYHTSVDSIVRSEAPRLRTKLKESTNALVRTIL